MASVSTAVSFARQRLSSPVGRNVMSLYVLLGGIYVVPLVSIPYLVRVLGPDGYGTVAFGQGLIAYFTIIVTYGFDYSATRLIATVRDDREAVAREASNIWGAKMLLFAITAAALLILVRFVPELHRNGSMIVTLYGIVGGGVLFPTWLFQGMERMSVISATNLAVRAAGVLAIFVFVHSPHDVFRYAVVLAAQSIIAGIIGFAAAFKMFGLRVVMPSWRGALRQIRDSTPFFVSAAATSLFTAGNAFVLGLLTDSSIVGYYSAGEKIVNSCVALIGPIAQAVYPRFSRLALESRAHAVLWARRMLAIMGGVGLLVSTVLLFCAPLLVRVVLGAKFAPTVAVIRLMSPLPVLIAVSNVLGVQLLFAFGHEKRVSATVLLAGLVNLILASVSAPHWGASGMAAAVAISQGIVTVGYFAWVRVAGLNPLKSSQAAV